MLIILSTLSPNKEQRFSMFQIQLKNHVNKTVHNQSVGNGLLLWKWILPRAEAAQYAQALRWITTSRKVSGLQARVDWAIPPRHDFFPGTGKSLFRWEGCAWPFCFNVKCSGTKWTKSELITGTCSWNETSNLETTSSKRRCITQARTWLYIIILYIYILLRCSRILIWKNIMATCQPRLRNLILSSFTIWNACVERMAPCEILDWVLACVILCALLHCKSRRQNNIK